MTVLLALRNTYSSHMAEEIKHHVYAAGHKYRISTRLVFFIAVSASNNEKAQKLLAV